MFGMSRQRAQWINTLTEVIRNAIGAVSKVEEAFRALFA